MLQPDHHEQNRKSWNQITPIHNSHKGDQAAFFRAGGTTLFDEERALLGDIADLDLVHLQCNCGQDTLSLAALGARVTGIDISDAAIAFAQQLSEESGVPGTFIRSDVYDWLGSVPAASFDVAFASYGTLCWVSDLPLYAQGVSRLLRPGGRYVIVEFHPVLQMFNEELQITYPYMSGGGEPILWDEGIGDYVGMSAGGLVPGGSAAGEAAFINPEKCVEYSWGLSEVISAFLGAGLRLTTFREYPFSNGCKFFPTMEEVLPRRWALRAHYPTLPQMYGLVVEK